MKYPACFAVLVFLCLISPIAVDAGWARERIAVCGTGDSQTLLGYLARAFEEEHPGTRINIPESIGSGGGIRAVERGECDIGRVAREPRGREKGLNVQYKIFAYSPVVFVVNPGVKGLGNITSGQIVGIYSGKITQWNDLGAKGGKIYVANREEGDSSRSLIERHIPGFKEIVQFAGKRLYSTPENIQVIEKHEGTIGYGPLAMVKDRDLVVLKVNGISPSEENARNGSYKMVMPLGIVWKGDLRGLSRAFADFLFSPRARKIISENGAFPAEEK